jgi:hypothetical protein
MKSCRQIKSTGPCSLHLASKNKKGKLERGGETKNRENIGYCLESNAQGGKNLKNRLVGMC